MATLSEARIKGRGNKEARLLIVDDFPKEEGQRVFDDPAARFLIRQIFREAGVELEDVFATYAVDRRPYTKKTNETSKKVKIGNVRDCRDQLYKTIKKIKPRVVIALGDAPLHGLLPIYKSKDGDDEKKSSGVTGSLTWRGHCAGS